MTTVLQVVGVMNRGGAEAMLMDILRHKSDDLKFCFLVNDNPNTLGRKGSYDDEIRTLGGEIYYIGSQLRLGYRRYFKEFKRIVQLTGATIVHTHLNAKNGIIAMAARKAGIKRVISHCHADIKFRGSIVSRLFNESEIIFQKFLIHRYATDRWGCSVEANRRLYYSSDQAESKVINNAITIEPYRPTESLKEASKTLRQTYNLPEKTLIISNVGRIVPHKNITFVVDVMAELKHRNIDVAFVVAGRNDSPNYVAEMKLRAKGLGIADSRLIFLGERADIPAVLRSTDVFVGPALKEGFGLVAVEAQAAQLPTVLYKGFPKSVDMEVGLVRFLNDFDTCKWADMIEEACKASAGFEEIERAVKAKGFDAIENTKKICEAYKNG